MSFRSVRDALSVNHPFNYDDRSNFTGLRDPLAGKQSADRILIGRCQTGGRSLNENALNEPRAGGLFLALVVVVVVVFPRVSALRYPFPTRPEGNFSQICFARSGGVRFRESIALREPSYLHPSPPPPSDPVTLCAQRQTADDEGNVLQMKCELTRVVGDMFHLSKSGVFPLNVRKINSLTI